MMSPHIPRTFPHACVLVFIFPALILSFNTPNKQGERCTIFIMVIQETGIIPMKKANGIWHHFLLSLFWLTSMEADSSQNGDLEDFQGN